MKKFLSYFKSKKYTEQKLKNTETSLDNKSNSEISDKTKGQKNVIESNHNS